MNFEFFLENGHVEKIDLILLLIGFNCTMKMLSCRSPEVTIKRSCPKLHQKNNKKNSEMEIEKLLEDQI
jgi:hypothetical protein